MTTVATALSMMIYIRGEQLVHRACHDASCVVPADSLAHHPQCTASSTVHPALRWSWHDGPTLIVVPAATVNIWVREL